MEDRFRSEISSMGTNGHGKLPRVVETVKRADDKLITIVRERPVVALCAALAVGYLFGRIVTRIG